MIRLIISLWLCGMVLYHATGQNQGDTWMMGYASPWGNPEYSIIHLDFNTGNLELKWDTEERFQFDETSSTICDTSGQPLLWTNGMQVRGKGNVGVIDTIAFEPGLYSYWDSHYWQEGGMPFGFPRQGGAIILPDPGSPGQYLIIYHMANKSWDYGFYLVDSWLHAKVQQNKDQSFTTIYKDSLIGPKLEWFVYSLNAVKHANGRDWWLITFEWESSKYYAYLADPSGIHLDHIGDVGAFVNGGLGQTVISPKGNYIGRTDTGSLDEGQSVTLFSFDRCQGNVSLIETLYFGNESSFQGVAFSPSERYFYADGPKSEIWQFDMWSDDIVGSQKLVGEFDGFEQPGWGAMKFGPMMQTPDGRIYVVPTGGSSEFLHVIDRPDLPGADCKLLQHYINLTVPNARSAPNIPNYRLGPLDGSPCDTLGLSNLATSRWRYEADIETTPLTIRFTDLSFFEPTSWSWTFGDGMTSEEVNPIHTYEEYGIYQVCQTVSNEYEQDSTCKWIEIAPYTSADDPKSSNDLSISPNPFTNELRIESLSDLYRSANITFLDLNGRSVLSIDGIPIPVTLKMPDIPQGIYICRIEEKGGKVTMLKVVRS